MGRTHHQGAGQPSGKPERQKGLFLRGKESRPSVEKGFDSDKYARPSKISRGERRYILKKENTIETENSDYREKKQGEGVTTEHYSDRGRTPDSKLRDF